MPEPRGYALSPEFADRVQDVVEQVEAGYQNPPPPASRRPNHAPQNIQRLRVTSDDPGDVETVNGVVYYPAVVRTFDVATGVFSDLGTPPTVKLFDPAGGTLAEDDEVEARQVAASDAFTGGQQWPVFEKITGGGGGPEKLILVDDNASVVGDPMGYFYDGRRIWPAHIIDVQPSGMSPLGGGRVYVVQINDCDMYPGYSYVTACKYLDSILGPLGSSLPMYLTDRIPAVRDVVDSFGRWTPVYSP